MQEEVTQKTIAFSIKSAKLTIQVLQATARKFLETQNKGKTKLHHFGNIILVVIHINTSETEMEEGLFEFAALITYTSELFP